MTEIVRQQLDELRRRHPGTDLRELPDGSSLVTVPSVPLPPGWNRKAITVRFAIPVGYPMANPDSFWGDADLRTANGAMPVSTQAQAPWPGQGSFLWFSFHPNEWNPNRDSLLTYLGVIRRRLSDPR